MLVDPPGVRVMGGCGGKDLMEIEIGRGAQQQKMHPGQENKRQPEIRTIRGAAMIHTVQTLDTLMITEDIVKDLEGDIKAVTEIRREMVKILD